VGDWGWLRARWLQQFATGHSLFGYARAGDGVLTGPFDKQLAGPELARILLPVLVPPAAWLLGRRNFMATAEAYTLLLGGVLIMVLIGQRMPLMITGLGLVAAALRLPRLRPVVIVAGAAGLVLLAATPMVSPPAYHRLVLTFSRQMQDFPVTQYGQLYARAWHIGLARPLVGRGFDGFRTGCPLPEYFGPTFGGTEHDGGGAAICAGHPHNFYFQALAAGGFPALVLFSAVVVGWMAPLLGGLWRQPDPLRVGLFAAGFIQLWPLASTSDFVSMPIGGWFFLTLGRALAESRLRVPALAAQPEAASAGVLKDAKLA
jgi:O-antigen ligase